MPPVVGQGNRLVSGLLPCPTSFFFAAGTDAWRAQRHGGKLPDGSRPRAASRSVGPIRRAANSKARAAIHGQRIMAPVSPSAVRQPQI